MDMKPYGLGDWTVLTPPHRRLDASIAEPLTQAFAAAARSGSVRFVIDLSAVDFMDSAGLGSLVFFRKRLGAQGQVVIAGAQQEVATILKITHLDRVFRLIPTSAAVRQLSVANT